MIDYQIAERAIQTYIEDNIEYPPLKNEEEFKHCCDMEGSSQVCEGVLVSELSV